jgi:hypothetical protein
MLYDLPGILQGSWVYNFIRRTKHLPSSPQWLREDLLCYFPEPKTWHQKFILLAPRELRKKMKSLLTSCRIANDASSASDVSEKRGENEQQSPCQQTSLEKVTLAESPSSGPPPFYNGKDK